MALVDPNIAMSFRMPEFKAPNALAQHAQIQQIMAAQDAQQMNALKMQEAQAALEERNKLRTLNPAAADYEQQLFRVSPSLGITYRKEQATTAAQKASEAKSLTEAAAAKQKMLGQAWRDISGRPSDSNIIAHLEDIAESSLYSAAEKASITKRGTDLLAMPVEERRMFLAQQGASASELKPSTQSVNRSGATDVIQVPAFGGEPTTLGSYADVPLPVDVETQRARIALASRAPGPVTHINTQLPASEEAQKEFMKESRQTYGTLKQAPTVLDNIEKAKALVPQAKGFMGAGGESVLQAASFLNNRLGTSIDTKGVTSAEELRSRLFLGIMDNLKKLDSQPSQQQQAALQIALGSIGTDPSALPRVLDVFGDTVRQKVDLYNNEIASAEQRGVKFPYNPIIKLKSKSESGTAASETPTAPRPAGVGTNWTLERDASGNTAWVSPDRKSFKEVK